MRILVVGGVAVAAFSQDALAGVIAHELGHVAGGDTGLSRVALRWHLVMGNLEARLAGRPISRVNPLAWLIRARANLGEGAGVCTRGMHDASDLYPDGGACASGW